MFRRRKEHTEGCPERLFGTVEVGCYRQIFHYRFGTAGVYYTEGRCNARKMYAAHRSLREGTDMDTCVASPALVQMGGQRTKAQRMNALSTVLPLAIVLLAPLQCGAAVAGPSACPVHKQANEAVSQLLADGNAAYEAGDLAKAEVRWAEIRECAGGTTAWPKAVFNLGLLEYRRKKFRQAIAYFHEVLQSHPNDKEPGANIMETNRNYSYRSALAISQCYEAMGAYRLALRYAWLAKTKYHYYSWCGTCLNNANLAVNKRIAYLTVRASQEHIWASVLVVGFLAFRKWKAKRSKRPSDNC
jgi:tetratricopeptide (TPR) repeat protein